MKKWNKYSLARHQISYFHMFQSSSVHHQKEEIYCICFIKQNTNYPNSQGFRQKNDIHTNNTFNIKVSIAIKINEILFWILLMYCYLNWRSNFIIKKYKVFVFVKFSQFRKTLCAGRVVELNSVVNFMLRLDTTNCWNFFSIR